MILFVGLGNPGKEYQYTRHNIGFEIIDSFHGHFEFPNFKSKFDGLYSIMDLFDTKIILFKPQLFMNLSGQPIKKVKEFFKIKNTANIIIIHDDIDMDFLKLRVKSNGGHGGHNGVRDTVKFIGNNFHRIKFGVKNRLLKQKIKNPADFVLEKFHKDERSQIEIFKKKFNKNLQYLIKKDFSLFKTKLLVS